VRLALAMAGAIACGSCASSLARLTRTPPLMTPDGVQFAVMQQHARSVAVAGNFNQWSTSSHPLARQSASGVWTAIVMLPPGEHLFMYVVDGTQWISPPAAEDYADDGFGARNGIVIVREKER
jgi:1,4-alpha-glucan branching enzyme